MDHSIKMSTTPGYVESKSDKTAIHMTMLLLFQRGCVLGVNHSHYIKDNICLTKPLQETS